MEDVIKIKEYFRSKHPGKKVMALEKVVVLTGAYEYYVYAISERYCYKYFMNIDSDNFFCKAVKQTWCEDTPDVAIL